MENGFVKLKDYNRIGVLDVLFYAGIIGITIKLTTLTNIPLIVEVPLISNIQTETLFLNIKPQISFWSYLDWLYLFFASSYFFFKYSIPQIKKGIGKLKNEEIS